MVLSLLVATPSLLTNSGPASQHVRTATSTPPALAVSRRGALLGFAAATITKPAFALFESPEQLALISLATAKPKLSSLVVEVSEVKRKRVKMPSDDEDDAYVFRFMRSVLDPAVKEMAAAAPSIKSERAQELPAIFKASVADLQAACRKKDAGEQVEALQAADSALDEFLRLASAQKYDVKARDDINGYDGVSGVLYPKFIFAK